MKKSAENRYPHSAELFRFCKEALNIKHNSEVKVIDQHVGSILGYDPADCSHWKKGKKNIKSLQTVNTIAAHLEIDSRFVTDIISGKSDLEESLQEFKGYGPLALSGRYQDEVKREFFRNPAKYSAGGEARGLEQATSLARDVSLTLTRELLAAADVQSLPLMLPELTEALAMRVKLQEAPREGESAIAENKLVELSREGDLPVVRWRAGEMKPHVRTLIAREIGRVLLQANGWGAVEADTPAGASLAGGRTGMPNMTAASGASDLDELTNARMNLFAGLLLVPGPLLQKATRSVNHSRDIVGQLADMFWVGRTVMNARLKDFVEHGN